MSESVTVLCSHGRCLAKIVRADNQVEAYASARTFDLCTVPIPNLSRMRDLLICLAPRWNCAIIRGAIADSERTIGVRRLLHDDPATGDKATLRAVPREWLSLDLDSLPRRPDVLAADLISCAHIGRMALPIEFRDARCIAQPTGSHGIKPGIRMRLWFWLSRSVTDPELRRWFNGVPVDHAIFGAAQPIYTASPLFVGRTDHLACRLVELAGSETVVAVPPPAAISASSRRSSQPLPIFGTTAETRECGHAALVHAAQRILAAPEGNRHRTIVSACCSLGPLIRAGVLLEIDVRTLVLAAAEQIGMDDPAEIHSAMTWAFARRERSLFGAIENE